MTPVAGVDGCPAGWIAVRWAEQVTHHLCHSFAEVLALEASVIAVDMPIGFPQMSGCAACWSARRILNGSSLRFPDEPPIDERGLRMEINA